VHITSLGQDYYHFNADKRQLVGENSGKVYQSGDRLEVQVARVDMEQGRIDFSLTDVKNEKFGRGKQFKSGSKKGGYSKPSGKKSVGKAKPYSKSKSSKNKKRK